MKLSLRIVCWILLAATPLVAQERTFRVGASTANITPPLGQLIVGGFSPFPADYVHDELHARCLVLDDGTTRLALVVSDNVGIPREVFDAAKSLIQQETGLDPRYVLTAATHTHSATTARSENKVVASSDMTDYQRFLARRIADGVRIAIKNLEPARIGWGKTTEESQVFNRRWFVSDENLRRNPFGGTDEVRMNPPRGSAALLRPAGPTDPEIAFLSVRALDKRPIALLANYSLHYVGGVPTGHISADYFGAFAQRIGELLQAEKLQPPFVGIMSNGTSGNINNINFRDGGGERLAPYEKIRQVADAVATRVIEAEGQLIYHDWVPLAAQVSELTLAVRKPSAEQMEWARAIRKRLDNKEDVPARDRVYCNRLHQLAESPDQVQVPLQALGIGDLGLAAIPFEVFVETGLSLKQKTPFGQTFTIELANGSFGYLPTAEHHALGGYETWVGTCNVEVEAAARIESTILKLLDELSRSQRERR